MRFQFTATVETLGYATTEEVTRQAQVHLTDPDWVILALEIGVWEWDGFAWATTVVASVDDGSPIGGDPASGLPAVWSV